VLVITDPFHCIDDIVRDTSPQLTALPEAPAQDNLRQVSQRPALEIGDDLLDDRVAAVIGLGRQHRQR